MSQQRALVSVDPGVRGCGVGLFVDGRLAKCAYVRSLVKAGHGVEAARASGRAAHEWVRFVERLYLKAPFAGIALAFEYPQVYQRGPKRTRADPNVAVLPLVGVIHVVAVLFPDASVQEFQPHDWKGNLEKETKEGTNVVEHRVRARLDAVEIEVFDEGIREARSMSHNLVDAVGIGMHVLGRFERRRVFASE